MSCRSTTLNLGVTSAARAAHPQLDDAQVQALFHEMKREGADQGVTAPTPDEFREGLENLQMRVRHDPRLSEAERAKTLARLDSALSEGSLPDGGTWHAVMWTDSAADTATKRLRALTEMVADNLQVNTDRLEALVEQWRTAPDGEYEDYAAPDRSFRYDQVIGVPTDKATGRALRKLGYEHYLAQPLPVFVYGTLRTGQGNDVLMDGAKEHVAPAIAHGVAVYGSNFGFPYATEYADDSSRAVGEIVYLTDDVNGDNARGLLDHLEGFYSDYPTGGHYERVARPVQMTNPDGSTETVLAWMYMARGRAAAALKEEDRIPHGDWVAERSAMFRRRH